MTAATDDVNDEPNDLNDQYAKRVLASMLWSPSVDGDGFDREVADRVADRYDIEVELNHEPARNADVEVYAKIDKGEFEDINNTKTTGVFNFTVATFHEVTAGEDGGLGFGFDGFRTSDALELEVNDNGLIVSPNATKYAFIVTVA